MAMADVIPLPGAGPHEWADLTLKVPAPRARIEPGTYQARTVSSRILKAYGRQTIELGCEIYQGDWTENLVLAMVPLFLGLPRTKGLNLSPNSKLARLIYLVEPKRVRSTKVSLRVLLQYKVFEVVVGDAAKDAEGHPLTRDTTYSVIRRVLTRLA
jgi:hypothetical protein